MLKAAKPAESNEIALRAAKNLRGILAEERWSGRRAALALGLTPMYVNRRLSGEAELSVSDVEMFARLLKLDPSTLYAVLLQPSDVEDASALAVIKTRNLDYGSVVSPIRRKGAVHRPRRRKDRPGPQSRAA